MTKGYCFASSLPPYLLECASIAIMRALCGRPRISDGCADAGESGRLSSLAPPPSFEPPMLVLSRKVGETILIGDNIAVTVVQVGPGSVRLGVEAPQEVVIVREEIRGQVKSGPQREGRPAKQP